jgi:tetratricopeptide (TPR) repeat protein
MTRPRLLPPPVATAAMHDRRHPGRPLLAAAALVAIAFLAHGSGVWNGWIWDDDDYVTANMLLRSPGGLARIWLDPAATPQYYPLVHTMFWCEHAVWGLWPAGYHTVNVALHAISAVVLWHVLEKLCVPWSWLGAALFAVHPVAVESVAWVTERKNTLSLCLGLLAARQWLEYRFGPGPVAADECAAVECREPSRLFSAFGLFVLALLAKTVVVTLVGGLAVIVWWKRGRLGRRDVLALAPLAVAGIPLAGVTAWLEKAHVGAGDLDLGLSAADRVVLAGRAIWFYAAKILWPHPLAFFYPRWTIDASAAWQWIFPATATALLVATVLGSCRLGRGPAAVALLFCGLLFPALGFFDVYPFKFSFVADHFQYHALVAATAALAATAGMLAGRFPPLRLLVMGWAGCVIAGCCGLTAAHTGVFRDVFTLYGDVLAHDPQNYCATHNLGNALVQRGDVADGERLLLRAVTLAAFPDQQSSSLAALAFLHVSQRRFDQALDEARRAVAVRRQPMATAALALALAAAGRLDEAAAVVATATPEERRLAPLQRARGEIGRILMHRGDLARAEAYAADLDADVAVAVKGRVLRAAGCDPRPTGAVCPGRGTARRGGAVGPRLGRSDAADLRGAVCPP